MCNCVGHVHVQEKMPHKLCSAVDLCIYFYNFTAEGSKYLVLEEKKIHALNMTGFQQMQVVSNLHEGQHWPVLTPITLCL